jgi:CRP/FNR family cyclic AMP-dependent transcriptional regulator
MNWKIYFTLFLEYDKNIAMKKRAFTEIVVSDFDKLNILAKSHLCNGMNKNEVQMIAPFFHSYQLTSGTDIYEEGDTEAFLCLIVSGTVKVCKGYGMPTEKVIITLGSGETVGEVSVIDEMPRSASVVANADTVLYALTRKNLIEMCNTSSVLWSKLIFNITLSLCSRLRHTNELLVDALNGGVTAESLSGSFGAALASSQHPFLNKA